MVRVQRVDVAGQGPTWTVLGVDHMPVGVIEGFLEYLRQTDRSPNTVRSYARALALWWEFLGLLGRAWDKVTIDDMTGFLAWLRTGLPPEVAPIGPSPHQVSSSTVAARLQAVRSFYQFQQLRGVAVAGWLYVAADRSRSPYVPFLAHIRRGPGLAATVRVRRGRRAQAPTLTPTQIDVIKDRCGRFDPEKHRWQGSVRDRFFFTLLEETGLRLGEALSLQHRDWHTGGGENPFIEVVPRPHPLGQRTKGGYYRKLFVSDDLDRLYAEYVWQLCEAGMDLAVADAGGSMDECYVLVNLSGPRRFGPMRPETIYKLVDRISRDLDGVLPAGWSPHWFRHTHATALLLSGRPVHVVSRRLGHADVQTTLNTYAWVTEDEEMRALADWHAVTDRWRVSRG